MMEELQSNDFWDMGGSLTLNGKAQTLKIIECTFRDHAAARLPGEVNLSF